MRTSPFLECKVTFHKPMSLPCFSWINLFDSVSDIAATLHSDITQSDATHEHIAKEKEKYNQKFSNTNTPCNGCWGGDRTRNLQVQSLSLYRLSYPAIAGAGCGDRTRMTLRSGDFKSPVYTNSTNPAWRTRQDSNLRPAA